MVRRRRPSVILFLLCVSLWLTADLLALGPASDFDWRVELEALIDRDIQPILRQDGGWLELEEAKVEDNCLYVSIAFRGACSDCSQSQMTLKYGITSQIVERFKHTFTHIYVNDVTETQTYAELTSENIEAFLDQEVRRLLDKEKTGKVQTIQFTPRENQQADITLHLAPPLDTIESIKLAIVNKIKKEFGPGAQVIYCSKSTLGQ